MSDLANHVMGGGYGTTVLASMDAAAVVQVPSDPYTAARQLVLQSVTNAGVAQALLTKLDQAAAAGQRGNLNAKAGIVKAFINQLEAQTGKTIAAEQAAALIQLAWSL